MYLHILAFVGSLYLKFIMFACHILISRKIRAAKQKPEELHSIIEFEFKFEREGSFRAAFCAAPSYFEIPTAVCFVLVFVQKKKQKERRTKRRGECKRR